MKALKSNFRHILWLWILFAGFVGFNHAFSQSLTLTQAEYYFDFDPGLGNGLQITVVPGSEIDVNFEMDVSGLSTGFHKAYFRTKDENNVWSHTNVMDIYVEKSIPQILTEIVYAEYFLDTDPGEGLGINIPIVGGEAIDANFEIELIGVSTGFHKAYFRTKNENNVWSLTSVMDFYVEENKQSPQPLTEIIYAEYFLDTDPGEGNGINVPIVGGEVADANFEIELDGVSAGFHKAYFRTKDENNVWSHTNLMDIYVEENISQILPEIVYAEYFLDTDAGEGNGINIPLVSSEVVDVNFEIDLVGVTAGFHKAYFRTKDAHNVWSLTSVVDIYVVVNQQTMLINIPAGWSGISSYMVPNDPSIENIFGSVVNEMVILQNFDGMYWPYAGVNTIGIWNDMDGYQIKMTTARQVTFKGGPQQNHILALSSGWNYLPVLNACVNDVNVLFSQIISDLVIVKEVAGDGVYWPQFGINTLGTIKPGKAYFVLVSEAIELEFPACGKSENMTLSINQSGLDEHHTPVGMGITQTPSTHTIAILPSAIEDFESGTFIGAYDQAGNCFGITKIGKENNSITIFGDDPTTGEKDGFIDGEVILFKNKSGLDLAKAGVTGLEPTFDYNLPQSDGLFTENGLSAITSFMASTDINGVNFLQHVRIFPNPSDGLVNIYGIIPGTALTVTDLRGKVLTETIADSETTKFDLSSYQPGVYFVEISQNGNNIFRKIVIR